MSSNLLGYWSHFNARYVCGFFALSLTFLSAVAILLLYPLISDKGLFTLPDDDAIFRWIWFTIDALFIIIFTCFLLRGKKNPHDEAFELEYNVIASRTSRREFYKEARIYFLEVAKKKVPLSSALKMRVQTRIRGIKQET